jgi:hypothetical protein
VTIERLVNPQEDEEEFKDPALSQVTINALLRQLEEAIRKRSEEITLEILNLTKYKSVMIQSSKDLKLDSSMNIHQSSLLKDVDEKITA